LNRRQYIGRISELLGKKNLLWWGFRGADAAILIQIPQFAHVFSLTAPLAGSMVPQTCLETVQKKREDLHTYNIELDYSEWPGHLHQLLFSELGTPTAVVPYRSDAFFDHVSLPQIENINYLGMFHELQAAFENKPWVERELRHYGVRTIPWQYFSSHNSPDLVHLLNEGSLVVRPVTRIPCRGGANTFILRRPDELASLLSSPHHTLFAVSHYLTPNIPLNINACVFRDGTVSFHGMSLQLIGIPSCTNHALGYCGNDFSQIRELDTHILDEMETMTLQVGKWLAAKGYLGVFGIDAIAYRDHVYFAEINPRFQGSSILAAAQDIELDRPDIYLSHMGAFLGLPAPEFIPLRELVRQQKGGSQIISYNRSKTSIFRVNTLSNDGHPLSISLLPAPDVEVVPHGLLFCAANTGRVTADGHALLDVYHRQVTSVNQLFQPSQYALKIRPNDNDHS
jgi:hypothetical protein